MASSQTNPLQLICGELSNKSITINLWRALKQITKGAEIRGKNEAFASTGGAHLSQLCQPAYLEIKRISSIRLCLSFEATQTLVSSLVLSRLDYCNALLAGSPQVLLDQIQRVINSSARHIFRVPKSAHITPFLYDLHWLPISSRVQYKIAVICFHFVSGTAPPYLSELLHLCSPSRCLRSAADTRIFRVSRMDRRTLGERSFQCIGPVLWNSLPLSVTHSSSLSSFKSKLKTHLLSSEY